MTVDARAHAWIVLQLSGIGPRALAQLLRAFGSPEAVVAATPAQRRAVAAPPRGATLDPDPARVAQAQGWLAATPGVSLVAWDDPDYPAALLEIADPPPVLWCRGRRELLARPALAIVGSRNATPQGCADAEAFAAALAARGLAIVSGLALGIDAAAHRGALRQPGGSIAVVATGPDRIYPAKNRELAHALAEHGAIVSEFAPGTPPLQGNFPRRNRLISGLARGVLVVEAALASGSLITARLAAEQGREVFALPGSIHSPLSRGCHRLIRDGAKLVETAQDIFDELLLPPAAPGAAERGADAGGRAATGGDADGGGSAAAVPDAGTGDPAAARLLATLAHAPASVDQLVGTSGLASAEVVATLTALELDGRVVGLAGGLWQRCR